MALTGYMIGGLCQATQADALAAFVAQFPKVENGYLLSVTSPMFSTPTNIGVWVQNENLLTAVYGGAWADFPVSRCDPALSVTPNIDAAGVLSVFSWGFASVVLFFFLGYTISVAINSIKRV